MTTRPPRGEACETLLAALPIGVAVLRGDELRFTYVNPSYQALDPGRTFLGATVAETWPELERTVVPLLRAVIADQRPFHAEDMRLDVHRPDGPGLREAYFTFTYQPLAADAEGRPGVLVTVVESTATVLARRGASDREAVLRSSEARFRLLASESPVAIYQTDAAGRLVFVNRAWHDLTGLDERAAFEPEAGEVVHPEDRGWVERQWAEAVATGGHFAGEYRLRLRSGKVVWVRAAGSAVRDAGGRITDRIGVLMDVTEARALQAQLAVTARLAALGTLVGGVAHEINNPLSIVVSLQAVMRSELEELSARLQADPGAVSRAAVDTLADTLRALQDAEAGAGRVARIVRDLTLLARPGVRRAPFRLRDAVDRAVACLAGEVPGRVTLRVEGDGPARALGTEGQVGMVLVDLLRNAVHAIPEGRPGTVTVRLLPGAPGMARLEVSDDGVGMSSELLSRIFDPFFTTQDVGAGMGLGLPLCHSIVTSHGGTIAVESEPGKGSTFRVEVPAAAEEAGGPPPG